MVGDQDQCKTLYKYYTNINAEPNQHYEQVIKKNCVLALPFVSSNLWEVQIKHADGVIFVGDLEGYNELKEIMQKAEARVLFVNNGNKEVVIDDCNVSVTNAFGEIDRMIMGCDKFFNKLIK